MVCPDTDARPVWARAHDVRRCGTGSFISLFISLAEDLQPQLRVACSEQQRLGNSHTCSRGYRNAITLYLSYVQVPFLKFSFQSLLCGCKARRDRRRGGGGAEWWWWGKSRRSGLTMAGHGGDVLEDAGRRGMKRDVVYRAGGGRDFRAGWAGWVAMLCGPRLIRRAGPPSTVRQRPVIAHGCISDEWASFLQTSSSPLVSPAASATNLTPGGRLSGWHQGVSVRARRSCDGGAGDQAACPGPGGGWAIPPALAGGIAPNNGRINAHYSILM